MEFHQNPLILNYYFLLYYFLEEAGLNAFCCSGIGQISGSYLRSHPLGLMLNKTLTYCFIMV